MKGTYVLGIRVGRSLKTKVGALGFLEFEKGIYVYVGSALNSIEKRVLRHSKKDKILRWHLDYLTVEEDVRISDVYVFEDLAVEERISLELSKRYEGVKGFGASDMKSVDSNLYIADDKAGELIISLGGVLI